MENNGPRHLLWVGILFLVWNLIGVGVLVSYWTMSASDVAALPRLQQDLWNGMPAWAWAAFAISVAAGTLGSIGLIMRKYWASLLFALSLIAVLIQFAYPFLIANGVKGGMEILALPIFILVVAVIQWRLSRHWQRRGWLA